MNWKREVDVSGLKYLIGANPCSGTRWLSHYLTACGAKCGHEQIFWRDGRFCSIHGTENQGFEPEEQLLECGHTVVDLCDKPGVHDKPIILFMRHPIKIINSLVAHWLMSGSCFKLDSLIQSVVYRFETLVATQRIGFICKIEEDVPALLDYLGLRAVPDKNFPRNHHNEGRLALSRDDILRRDPTRKLDILLRHYPETL